MRKALDTLLHPKAWVLALMTVLSVVLVVYFLSHGDGSTTWLHGAAYLFSAYTLVAIVLRVPAAVTTVKGWLSGQVEAAATGHPLVDRAITLLADYDTRSAWLLRFSLGFNLVYAVWKLAAGAVYRSLWMVALGSYYALLALMRFSLLRSLEQHSPESGLKVYRRTAWRLNLLTLLLTGIFTLLYVNQKTFDYPGMLIYAMALYTFVKVISAVSNLVKRRREDSLPLAAARGVTFSAALVSLLALQTAMLYQFGDGSETAQHFAHVVTGIFGLVVVCLMITLTALMLARADREGKAQAALVGEQAE